MNIRSACIALLLLFSQHCLAAVKEYTLSNGLQVFVKPDHRAPVVISQVWYKVGGSYEPNGLTGISHALEHMMFKGTKKHGPQVFSHTIAKLGGLENAMTGQDETVYFQVLAADKLPVAFELEADRMQNLTIDPKEFAKEIEVVKEERRMRTEDNPSAKFGELFLATAFVASPYHHPVVGWMDDLNNMTAEHVRAWYQKWYAPNNAFIVVVGDVDPDAVLKLAKKYFGNIPKDTQQRVVPKAYTPAKGTKLINVNIPAKLPELSLGYMVPGFTTTKQQSDAIALAVLSSILNERLSKKFVRQEPVANSISTYYDPSSRLRTLFSIDATPNPGHDVDVLEEEILKTIDAIKTTGVTEKELQKVRVNMVSTRTFRKDSIYSEAFAIGSLIVVGLPWQLDDKILKQIQQVTSAQIQAAAQKYLTPDRLTIGKLKPLPMHTTGAQS